MSMQALAHVWNVERLRPELKLLLIWIANGTSELGHGVVPEWHGMADFACYPDWRDGPSLMAELIDAGHVAQPFEDGFYHLVYGGPFYEHPSYSDEPKRTSVRVQALLDRDGPNCRYCKKPSPTYHVDHVIPKSRGGDDTMDNLVLACPPCNLSKGARTPSEWLASK